MFRWFEDIALWSNHVDLYDRVIKVDKDLLEKMDAWDLR